jgi:low temperature requirement protein LtrA
VAQLADGLHADASLSGAVAFTGLFVPVWWTWTTYAYVADLFDGDEGVLRVVPLGAMLLVAGWRRRFRTRSTDGRRGFVVAYALLHADLVALYAWAWATDRGPAGG